MRNALRVPLALAGLAGFFGFYWLAARGLSDFGHYAGPYGDLANELALGTRQVTATVSAVNFDIRAVDTLGEEFILFASVLGAIVLLREPHEREVRGNAENEVPPLTDGTRIWTFALTSTTVLFGLYIVTHGQLTPGGGFQGGAILATAPLLIYLAGGYGLLKKIAHKSWVEVGEALGAGGFALVGIASLLAGVPFLGNFLPLSNRGSLVSGGTMPVISFLTGLEVAGGFVLLLSGFVSELQSPKSEKESD